MRKLVFCFLVVLTANILSSDPINDKQRNLQTCLSGQFPTLCNRRWLTPEQLQAVLEAEKRENLKTCLTGKYPSLCNHTRLSKSELEAVRSAERRENLQTSLWPLPNLVQPQFTFIE